jgi:hypothetical protein
VKSIAINVTLFKLGWLSVVFSAAAGLAQIGVAAVALVALVHLVRAKNKADELVLLVAAALIGLTWETFLIHAGALSYSQPGAGEAFAPYWIVSMWVLFATTLNVSMNWLRKNLVVAAVAGAIGGPLSFLAGEKIGAVTVHDAGVWLIALGWAVLLPIVAALAGRYNGYAELPVGAGERE